MTDRQTKGCCTFLENRSSSLLRLVIRPNGSVGSFLFSCRLVEGTHARALIIPHYCFDELTDYSQSSRRCFECVESRSRCKLDIGVSSPFQKPFPLLALERSRADYELSSAVLDFLPPFSGFHVYLVRLSCASKTPQTFEPQLPAFHEAENDARHFDYDYIPPISGTVLAMG